MAVTRGRAYDPWGRYPAPQEILPRIHLGIGHGLERDAAVSARLHSFLLGFEGKRVPQSHPNYLTREKTHRFSINWVDGPARYFEFTGVAVWRRLLDWLDGAYEDGHHISIRCDKGQSRSPSVAATWLARRGVLPSSSFADAIEALAWDYPAAAPGDGIAEWLTDNWAAVCSPSTSRDHVTRQANDQEASPHG